MSSVDDNYYPTKLSFLDRLIDQSTRRTFKKQKYSYDFDSDMAFFASASTQHLVPPSAPLRKRSQRFAQSHDDIDDFLSSDLELSFASNVSLNSPPRKDHDLMSDCEPMDISPAPPPKTTLCRLSANGSSKPQSRPRASTSAGRLFGSDISNNSQSLLPSPNLAAVPSLKSAGSTHSGAKRTQRSALPTEWFSTAKPAPPSEFSSPMGDPMDVDTSYVIDTEPGPVSFQPVPQSAAPTVTAFDTLFYNTMSPRRSFESPAGPQHKKRRSLSPDPGRVPVEEPSSSPMVPSSPSQGKLERMSGGPSLFRLNSKPTLQGLGAPSSNFLKRPRRPALSAMVSPSDHPIQSAYPVLSSASGSSGDTASPVGAPPVRRAFSALIPNSVFPEHESDESSFDGPDMSSPAQAYSRRQQVKTVRRCDGTEDFRPLTGATAMVQKESPSAKFMAAGLPGFGDNESHGKILLCHRVTEDGLMRINSQTLNDLLDNKYDSEITDFHVIDCRFDYEYNGGHIPGAVNINTTAAVEELLLGPSLTKPRPSVSGDKTRKTILVFHCEFSAKRAPTFAKHLRAKDRSMNNHVYPKICYPEVYILEGGYCQYFKTSAHRCEPPSYVTMDDPNHASSRREDLDQFRKARFGRHKSYAYGDGPSKTSLASQQLQQPKRNTAPSAPPSLFAAATAARSRRGGGASLMTLVEDCNVTADADDTDTDLGDSPCPPPTKATAFKTKKNGRGPLVRAETYNPVLQQDHGKLRLTHASKHLHFRYDPTEALQAIVPWRAIRYFSCTQVRATTQQALIPCNTFHPQSQLMPDLNSIHKPHGLQTHSPCHFSSRSIVIFSSFIFIPSSSSRSSF
ncbi:hypothetical protein K443DRAFT_129827 [Laccaria amethystina LaAM-08-1]|uniref:M-phase inducer phosphatase n=1 Tax=Laccaria amethystina LaAM-08-1 TaxID=1095629 RepID=A0A0C9YEN5_9AGAR|nr:hypothetical protein K443DRAFT_129827 [Laccaria amethystina LaAM-08-1]